MKKIVLGAVLGILFLGAVIAFACTVEDRDRYYDKCVVDRQCGDNNLCKSDCLNAANKWFYNGCKP